MKKIIGIIILILSTISISLAGEINDCSIIKELIKQKATIQKGTNSIPSKLPTLSKDNNQNIVKTALNNLNLVCSGENINGILNSKSFINHLINVYFRYLDGIQIKGNYLENYDPDGVARRKIINSFIEKTNQDNPSSDGIEELKKAYYKYWTNTDNKLYYKYRKFCETLPKINNIIHAGIKPNISDNLKKECLALAENRLAQETLLVNHLIKLNYYKTLKNKLFNMFNNKFAKQRDDLYNEFVISLGNFEYLVTKFIKVTDANTK